ncbi:HAD-IA family hydrolase [Facilibium subflavum]|uniref:HAD-IA family hydrolase n=1 Tax=Facilibium subflavum TaxID=2219058 RepID=UPI000E659E33|nr:HAD-IA family hydrolase [Facilibium subflavum]
MNNIKHIFFDLDGTLIDSVSDITVALNKMRNFFKLAPLSRHTIANIIGKGFPTTTRKVLGLDLPQKQVEANAQQALLLTLKAYEESMGEHTRIYDGVVELLNFCQSKAITMAVVTNKEYQHAVKTLDKLKLLDYFDIIVGGDTTEYYKPHTAPLLYAMQKLGATSNDSLMVGDSENDYLCAHALNVPCVLITHGYSHGKDISLLPNAITIDQFNQLGDMLKQEPEST